MATLTAIERNLWFFDTRVVIRVSYTDGMDDISVLESLAPFGDAAPLHLHRNEDEVFLILQGEMRFKVADQEFRAGAGEIFLAPKGIPHTYRVESAQGARWLTITTGQDFERFVRAIARPAETEGLPAPSEPATREQDEALAEVCLRYGIELIGLPLT
jgi:mannose-6-phosphate isomerase-like protein (cupin superfamily)